MNPNQLAASPWSMVPRQDEELLAQQEQMAQMQQQMTPDMSYPSYPNPAGLGLQIPFPDQEPPVITAPAYQEPQVDQMAMIDPSISPWGAMRG